MGSQFTIRPEPRGAAFAIDTRDFLIWSQIFCTSLIFRLCRKVGVHRVHRVRAASPSLAQVSNYLHRPVSVCVVGLLLKGFPLAHCRGGSFQSTGGCRRGEGRGGERVEEGQLRQRVAALTLNRRAWSLVWSSAWHRVLTVKSATTSPQNCTFFFYASYFIACGQCCSSRRARLGAGNRSHACVSHVSVRCLWSYFFRQHSPGAAPPADFIWPVKQGHIISTL